MPRPTNRQDLIAAASGQYEKLWKMIGAMPPELQTATFAFEDRDRTLRDVLIHLHEWHRMMADWHRVGTVEGGMPAVPGEGYTWKTLPALNAEIWRRYQHVPLEESKKMLKKSHEDIMALIEGHTDAELFERKVYPWTKTSTLGAYFIGSTSSHYDWAMKKIKRHIKTAGA